jgi:hypothetical protein
MRPVGWDIQIQEALAKSHRREKELILDNSERREYFRMAKGQIIEYDLTRQLGRKVRLDREEKDAIRDWKS